MSGSEKGGNNRRKSSRHRDRSGGENRNRDPSRQENRQVQGRKNREKDGGSLSAGTRKNAGVPRLKWTPPKIPAAPLPVPDCPVCGRPIEDIAAAIQDRASREPAHFECIIEKIGQVETRGPGDVIGYIGGGRFGILSWQNPQMPGSFRIKRIIEWEEKESRDAWRMRIADRYSMT